MKTNGVAVALASTVFAAAGTAGADTFTNLGLAIRLSGPAQAEVSWDTATNAAYRLEACASPASPTWAPCAAEWRAGDGQRCCTNVAVLVGQAQFYRVAVTNAAPVSGSLPTSWCRLLGGSGNDLANWVEPTSDGGCVIASQSNSTDGDALGNHGLYDGLIARFDIMGGVQWRKCFGGSGNDYLYCVKPTADGGYICAGSTTSTDGDVSGNHGGSDAWLIKLNSDGVIAWQKCSGGSGNDEFLSVEQTVGGGYIACGDTQSRNGDVSGNHGAKDGWVVKVDASGNLQWQKCLGGGNNDDAKEIHQTSDGGYILAGFTLSVNGDISGNHGGTDGWVVKLDAAGGIEWQRVMGGSQHDQLWSVQQTTDGGYITAGLTYSHDGDISGNLGGSDCWIIKLDATGQTQWQRTLGGSNDDLFRCIRRTTDVGYIATGYSASTDGQISGHNGPYFDLIVFRFDSQCQELWHRCLGGAALDYGYAVAQTQDGGYVVAGASTSQDGDIEPFQAHAGWDMWVIKLLPGGLTFFPDSPAFSDSFSRYGSLAPWITNSGNWSLTKGVLCAGPNTLGSYASTYLTNNWSTWPMLATNYWTNFWVEGRVQLEAGAGGGGLGGCLNPATGAHYAAWICPEDSPGGSNVLKLLKF